MNRKKILKTTEKPIKNKGENTAFVEINAVF